ncbi:tetratricopeptide repeat protein [Flavobacteriales bacterium]|nr:tetratricopeptide repeat protein [Flavobacteriales bacterium]
MKKIFNFLKSLALFTFTIGLNAQEVKVNELLSKADIHFENGNDSAIHYTSLALELSIKNSDRKGEMNSLFQVAKNKYDRGDLANSLEAAYQSLAIAKTIKSYTGKTAAQNTIAKIHNKNKEFEKAKLLTKQNISLAIHENDSISLAIFYEFYSSLYRSLGIIDSSLFYINKAIQINKTLKNDRSLGFIYNNLGIFHFSNGRNDSSLYYFHKSLAIRILTKDIKNQIQSKNNIGYINLQMGNNNLAISLFKEAIELCRKHNSITYLDLSYTNLSEAYEQLGMHKNALTSFKKYSNLKDSVNGEKVKERILQFETEIKLLNEKEKRNSLNNKLALEKGLQRKQNILIILLLIILIVTIVALRVSKRRALETLLEKEKTNAAKAIIDEQEKIREEIAQELHDGVGGSLAGVKLSLSNLQSENKCPKLLEEIEHIETTYQEIRNISRNLTPVSFQKNSLCTTIGNYLHRTFPNLEIGVCFQCYPQEEINKLAYDQKVCVYRIIQELATNIQKHALASNVNIDLTGHESHLTILVEDNGKGFDTKKMGEGIGFSNIQKRITLYDGKIEVDSKKGNGTTIIIDIPYKNI